MKFRPTKLTSSKEYYLSFPYASEVQGIFYFVKRSVVFLGVVVVVVNVAMEALKQCHVKAETIF